MKKLLSLLSVLTISGTVIPTTIAASPYNKKQEKLNSDINYLQTNNLKKLDRNRRENKNKISGIVSIIGPKENKRIDFSTGLILDNKFYYCSKFTNSLDETDLITSLTKRISLEWSFLYGTNGIMLNNKQYVIQNDGKKVFEIDNNKMNLIIEPDGKINSSKNIVALNDKVYFVSDNGKIYEYNQTTKEQKIVMKLNEEIYSLGVVLNNKLYFGSNTGKIYEYEPLKLIESDVIDLQEQIRRGVYLYYQEQNPNSYVKNIEFNMNDLKYSDIELIKREFVSNIKEVENICDGTAKFENRTSDEEERQTQSCKYTKQNIESYQILKGLNKRIDNTLEKGTSNTGTSSILNSNSKSTTSQTGGEVSAGGSLFGIGLSAIISYSQGNEESSTSQTEKSNSKTENISQIISNSSSIDLSNVIEKQKIETKEIEFPSQKVKVGGNQIKKLTFTLNKTITKNKFIFNQHINGKIKVKIIDEYNNIREQNLLIKDIISSLKNNDLLPKEIVINNSDISFQGSFLLNKVSSSNLNIVTEEIDTI